MSRARSQNGRKGPQLPFAMQQKLGLPQNTGRHRTQVGDRKQRRQEERQGNRQHGHKRQKVSHTADGVEDEDEDLNMDDIDEDSEPEQASVRKMEPVNLISRAMPQKEHKKVPLPSPSPSLSVSPVPHVNIDDDSDDLSRGSREYSPEVVLDASSSTFRTRQAEDDADILALERKLGMKSRKTKVLEDGFDDILGDLDDSGQSKNGKQAAKEWLQKKRTQKIQPLSVEVEVENDSTGSDETSADADSDVDSLQSISTDVVDDDDDFGGFDEYSEDDEEDRGDHSTSVVPEATAKKRVRENPYVAPTTNASTAKYVPPSRRTNPDTDTARLEKLRRQAQGHLNKLSEANIISIVDEFDGLYQTNPRQDVTTVLVDLLLSAFLSPSSLQNTYIILHAAFLAALYKILGADFGAEVTSRLIETLDKHYNDGESQGKETLNLVSLMANLFTFGVISSTLVYDYIKLLLSKFSENSAELLLRIIRDCGPQLRSDDPRALKGIVQIMNETTAKMTSHGQPINIRTRVMMDTITDLKNNKTRQATNAAGITGEHLTRMRKALGSLNSRQLRATEPLGITRNDILNSDKKGKWWLVGASWKGNQSQERNDHASELTKSTNKQLNETSQTSIRDDIQDLDIDYQALARHLNLISPIHRSIFVAISSAEDPNDAQARLSKLRLTRKQEPEIARVLIRTCRAEPSYNPYYSVLARLLLRDAKRYKMSFQIALWKFFDQIGERQDVEEDGSDAEEHTGGDEIGVGEIANVARMYASLIAKSSLNLDTLKTLNIGMTKEKATLFLEVLLITLLTHSQLNEQKIVQVFSHLEPARSKSLSYFLRNHVRKSDLVSDKTEKKKLKQGCQIAEAALVAMERERMGLKAD